MECPRFQSDRAVSFKDLNLNSYDMGVFYDISDTDSDSVYLQSICFPGYALVKESCYMILRLCGLFVYLTPQQNADVCLLL